MLIHKNSCVFCILLIFICVTSSFAQQSKADGLFEAANQWVEKGDAQKAIKGYLNARTEYLKEKNYKRALTCTQNVAMYYQDTGNVGAAEQLILETISVIPASTSDQLSVHASLQDNLGYTYLLDGRNEEAIKAYSKSIQLYDEAGMANTSKQAFELVNRATTYFGLFQYELCVEDMKRAIKIYENDDQASGTSLAESYRTLASAFSELNKFDNALQSFQKGLSFVSSDGVELKAVFLNDIGNVYLKKLDYAAALEKYKEANAINESIYGKDADHYALNLINIASVYKERGDLDKALEVFQEMMAIYQSSPPQEASHLIDVLIMVSGIVSDFGMFSESQKLLDEAMNIAVTSYGENSVVQADVYMSFASAASKRSEFDLAIMYYFKALSILQENKYPESTEYAIIYNNIGLVYDELKEIDLALQYKIKALDLYKEIYGPVHPAVIKATGNIGLTYEVAEDYEKAIEYLNKSVDMRLKVQSPSDDALGADYLNIGLMYLKLQQPKPGVEFLEKARVIYDPYVKNLNKAMIYNRLAYGYEMLGDMQRSKQYIQKALVANTLNFDSENFESNPERPDFIDYYELNLSYIAKVNYYTRLGDKVSLMKGEKLLAACDEIIRSKAIDLNNATDRLRLAQLNGFYTEAAMLLADKMYKVTGDPAVLEKAFYYSERSKANELLADIQRSKVISVGRVPKKLQDRSASLTTRMNTLQQQIASAYTTGNLELITKLKAQQTDFNKEYAILQHELSAAVPEYGVILNQRTLPSWHDVKKTLDDRTAFVSYTITDSAKYILIGNSSTLILKSIPQKTNLDKLIKGYINQIKFQGASMKEFSDRLTDILWVPVETAFTDMGLIEKVIIIPEGTLNFLPFESLGKGKYLIENYSIRYHYSGALLVQAGQSLAKSKPSMIAMAPVFEDKKTNFVNKSCQRFAESAVKTDSVSRAFTLDGQYITPLPATETEVSKITQIHMDKGSPSKYFLKEAAQEEVIKKGELANYDYVHLATHGFVNTQYPELSGLLLTQDASSKEDGVLYSGEILGLTLKANLVTLSACETALGKKIEGEGIRGLTTAFLFAGARNVVASLWKVADESTSLLMIRFYNELLSGKDKATALRFAKQSLISGEQYNHPYYWAPFIQVGGN